MNLTCPACGSTMHTTTSQGVEVDVCSDCAALWLDRGEFDALVAQRFSGGAVEDLFDLEMFPALDPRTCPIDDGPMDSVFFMEIELDRCRDCGGVFLDAGDRADLRARSARERDLNEVRPVTKLPAFDDATELTIDRDALQVAHDRQVNCGACGATVSELNCMKRQDQFWCESCVVAGDYPGGHGPTISSRIAEAAVSMAHAKASLDQSRQKQRVTKLRKEAPRTIRGGRRMHPEEYGHFVDSVRSTADKLLGMFRKDD